MAINMKKLSGVVKHIISMMSSMAKAKSMAIKSKTSAAKARLIMFSLMKNKKFLLKSLSQKIHNFLGQHEEEGELLDKADDQSKAIVLYDNAIVNESQASSSTTQTQTQFLTYGDHDDQYEYEDDDKYPDLRHSLFDEEEDFEDLKTGGSVIDMVKNSKEEGENFNLEDEIDHVADLFINRFHKQMRFQKVLSFKRFQEMLERST